jgi:hypothetical protein
MRARLGSRFDRRVALESGRLREASRVSEP